MDVDRYEKQYGQAGSARTDAAPAGDATDQITFEQ